jgi:FtsP/CotA-like multicopper oxidase with cupredoxin domain
MTQPEQFPAQPENQNPEAGKSLFTRRQFVGAGIMAAAALALPKSAQAGEGNCNPTTGGPINQPCGNTINVLTGADFDAYPPITITSSGGSVSETLTTQVAQLQGTFTPNQQPFSVRTYNCSVPGPNFSLLPGDRINITLKNEFPANDLPVPFPENFSNPCPMDLSQSYTPGCFYTTNLHFHGLHVSPQCTSDGIASDSVLVEVQPGSSQQYCVQLPDFHAPGTHWYHSHLHGATGIQVSNGLAGAIIIKEPPENQIVPPERDKVWLIQEIVDVSDPNKLYNSGGVPTSYLVNGIYQPTITVNRLQWQRWRFINAGATPRSLTNLKLVKTLNGTNNGQSCTFPAKCTINPSDILPMWLIAVDGISFYGKNPQPQQGWDLAPGNRADFLVWFPANTPDDATYYLIKDVFTAGGGAAQVLAQIKFTTADKNGQDTNNPSTLTISGKLPDYLQPIEYQEIFGNSGGLQHPVQDIRFTIPKNPGTSSNGFGVYEVNEAQYGLSGATDIEVDLNTAEIWTLRNLPFPRTVGSPGSPHPFHIHVNPFQLVGDKIDPNGPNDSSNWRWWDTIAVAQGSCVPVVHRFPDYDGKYVLHCHILIHEDLGMMRNVVVNGTGTPPCTKLSKSSFTPSANPQYVTFAQVCNNLPTNPYQSPGTTANPNCGAGSCSTNSLTTSTPSSQASPGGKGLGGGKGSGGGKGLGGGQGSGGGKGLGGGLGKS